MKEMAMTFYWGHMVTLLFDSWTTEEKELGLYVGSLFVVIVASVLFQWISTLRIGEESLASEDVQDAQVLQVLQRNTAKKSCDIKLLKGHLPGTLLYLPQMGLSYLIMLCVMSFNGGVFIAAVLGQTLGYILFGLKGPATTRLQPDSQMAQKMVPLIEEGCADKEH